MSLSKASKPPLLFTTSATTTGASASVVTTAVGRRQWKVKEVLWHRVPGGTPVALTKVQLLLVDGAGKEFVFFEDASPTDVNDLRLAPILTTGEYFVDSDAEVKLNIEGVATDAVCTVRITGSLVS